MDRDGLRAKGGGSVGMGFGMSGVWLGVGDWEPGDWGAWGIHRNGIWDEGGFGWVSEMGNVEINWIWGLGGSIGMGFGMSGGLVGWIEGCRGPTGRGFRIRGVGWVFEVGDVEINWIWDLGGSIGMGFGMSGGWLGVRDQRLSGFGVWGGP